MHFRGEAERKKHSLSGAWQTTALEFLCRTFANRLDKIIKDPKTEKVGCSYLYVAGPALSSVSELRVIFALDSSITDGYQINNFEFADWPVN